MRERDWDGRVQIDVEGWGVCRWLNRHVNVFWEPPRFGDLVLMAASVNGSSSSATFELHPLRQVRVTNTLQVALLTLRAFADLPDQDLFRACAMHVSLDSLRRHEVTLKELCDG